VTKTKSWLPAYIALGTTWGCSFLFVKEGLHVLTPFGVAFFRCVFGLIALLVIMKVEHLKLPTDKVLWAHLGVAAFTLNIVPNILLAVAETRMTSVLAGLINGSSPIWALFFLITIFRDEKSTRVHVTGMITGLVGVLVLVGVWRGFGSNPWWAVGAMILTVALYGFSFPYSRRFVANRGVDPRSLATAQVLIATAVLTPPFFIDGYHSTHITWLPVASLVLMGVFGTGLAYVWNYGIIQRAGSHVASTVTYLTPVVATIVGFIFLHEHLTWNQPVGAAIVLLGAAIGQDRFRRTQTLRSDDAAISK
jgi:drug/metabolite transporter (DMT)-like permease